ncbi:uncharacterized protein CTRU02_211125 [Colletotrichum truncatum]|uniref:Uncharacterized protein n=1 Tax=Colletotrichum truncatum TaxID=5467 RepID=A0ACC3YS87_COLTU|nr:uncharacterized protein CTRU02_01905 [Colletotrichum truncatum]KAF6799034.1 hypothetical protein CTRU02_01905 [Colletotrichum truncatum]
MSHRRVSAEGRAVADSTASKFGGDGLTSLSPSRARALSTLMSIDPEDADTIEGYATAMGDSLVDTGTRVAKWSSLNALDASLFSIQKTAFHSAHRNSKPHVFSNPITKIK